MRTRLQTTASTARAFTLTEVLIAMTTMLIIIGAALAAYLYSLKMLQFTKPKLEASDQARKALALVTDDVRSAHRITLGTRTGSDFVELPAFSTQIASAMKIYPGTNTNSFVIYYWNGTDETLRRSTNNNAGPVIVSGVTNETVFAAQDYRGHPYTNQFASMVISMKLQINQLQYPRTAVGPGNYYDFYQLRAKINKRAYL